MDISQVVAYIESILGDLALVGVAVLYVLGFLKIVSLIRRAI